MSISPIDRTKRICLNCQGDISEHVEVEDTEGFIVEVCYRSTLKNVCPMCCRIECRCSEIFSKPGSFPVDAPLPLALRGGNS